MPSSLFFIWPTLFIHVTANVVQKIPQHAVELWLDNVKNTNDISHLLVAEYKSTSKCLSR